METRPTSPPRLSAFLDRLIRRIGAAVAWLNAALVLVILVQVVLRYVFGKGMVSLEELQWHIYAVCIMIGVSYGVTVDAHIRLDVLYRNFSPRRKEWVEILGILFLLMPLLVILFLHGLDFVHSSYLLNERSDSPLGLPYRWLIKSVIPLSMALLGLAALSRLVRAVAALCNKD